MSAASSPSPTPLSTQLAVQVTGITRAEQEALADILGDVKGSMDRLMRAARKWVDLPEKTRGKIVEQTQAALRPFWARLERVGLGLLHPQLAGVGGRAEALLGRLPLADQERYLAEGMPVAVVRGRGYDQKLVDVSLLSEEQRNQVFKVATDGTVTVREFEAQKAWLADKAARALTLAAAADDLVKVERPRWKVEKGRVWLKGQAVEAGLTKKDLLAILKDMGD